MAQTDHDSTYTNGLAEYGFEKSSFGARVWVRVIAYAGQKRRQKKTRQDKKRQEKRREEKRREEKRRQEKTIKRREDQRRQGIQKMARASRLFCCRAGS